MLSRPLAISNENHSCSHEPHVKHTPLFGASMVEASEIAMRCSVINLVSRLSLPKFSHMLEESDIDHNVGFLEGPGGIGMDVMAEGSGILNASTGVDGGPESPLPLLLLKGEWDTVE